MKVWLCAHGNYSDYAVKAIYSTLEAAQTVTAAYGWDEEPKEFELDPAVPQEIHEGKSYFAVILYHGKDGKQEGIHVELTDQGPIGGVWGGERHDGGRNFVSRAWAKDQEHAIKIAADRKAQMVSPFV